MVNLLLWYERFVIGCKFFAGRTRDVKYQERPIRNTSPEVINEMHDLVLGVRKLIVRDVSILSKGKHKFYTSFENVKFVRQWISRPKTTLIVVWSLFMKHGYTPIHLILKPKNTQNSVLSVKSLHQRRWRPLIKKLLMRVSWNCQEIIFGKVEQVYLPHIMDH